MKKKFLYLAAATALTAVTSCADKTPDVTGSWQGVPERINVPGAATATGDTEITFYKDGNVTLSTSIDLTEALTEQEGALETYQASVAANASINGTYKFVDGEDDEIVITFDNPTLTVTVDPSEVKFSENLISGQEEPAIAQITALAAQKYQMALTPSMKAYYAKYLRLDDVKVKNGTLKFEINDVDYIFTAK